MRRSDGEYAGSVIPRDYWEHRLRDLIWALGVGGSKAERVESLTLPQLGKSIPVRSGRAALVAAIQALGLEPGSRVGVPLFCCAVVFKAIETAGCRVCFLDVDPETFCLSLADLSAKRRDIDAIIAAHMFGNPCDVEEVYRSGAGLPVIEDCAQALGSRFKGQPCGVQGDVAFFSFRSGKYVSAGEGGALFSRHPVLTKRLHEIIADFPRAVLASDCLHAAKVYAKSLLRTRPLYGWIGLRLWKGLNKSLSLSATSPVSLGQIHRSDLALVKRRLSSLAKQVTLQRENADLYSRLLRLDPGMVYRERPKTFCNRYLYPITFPTQSERDAMASHLLEHRIDTMKYLDDIVEIATQFHCYDGSCPVAESLSKRVLTIPSYHILRNPELEHIVKHVNRGWLNIRRRSPHSPWNPAAEPLS